MEWMSATYGAVFGGVVTYIVQSILMQKQNRHKFREKQIDELYSPLQKILNEEARNYELSDDLALRYDFAKKLTDLIDEKSIYASKRLEYAYQHLVEHLAKETEWYKNRGDANTVKRLVWEYENETNEQSLDDMISLISEEVQLLKAGKF